MKTKFWLAGVVILTLGSLVFSRASGQEDPLHNLDREIQNETRQIRHVLEGARPVIPEWSEEKQFDRNGDGILDFDENTPYQTFQRVQFLENDESGDFPDEANEQE